MLNHWTVVLLFLGINLAIRVRVRSCKYVNNIVEQDHCRIKRRVGPMQSFKRFDHAVVVLAGIELVERLKKGQYRIDLLAGVIFYAASRVRTTTLSDRSTLGRMGQKRIKRRHRGWERDPRISPVTGAAYEECHFWYHRLRISGMSHRQILEAVFYLAKHAMLAGGGYFARVAAGDVLFLSNLPSAQALTAFQENMQLLPFGIEDHPIPEPLGLWSTAHHVFPPFVFEELDHMMADDEMVRDSLLTGLASRMDKNPDPNGAKYLFPDLPPDLYERLKGRKPQ